MTSSKFRTIVLVILDGWGVAPAAVDNAITNANLPNYNSFLTRFPNSTLLASGEAVGLSNNDPGNTEIGHLNIGAGRIVSAPISQIDNAITDGSFLKNNAFSKLVKHLKTYNSALHLLGLFGTGRVHSSTNHLYTLLELARKEKIEKVYLHLFTDGRDSPPTAARSLITKLEDYLKKSGTGKIASIAGRFWAMDRDRRFDRTRVAYNALFGKGQPAKSTDDCLANSYKAGVTDEFIVPTVINNEGRLKENDCIFFFNHRGERAIQLTQFLSKDLKKMNLFFVTLTEYDKHLPVSAVAFPPRKLSKTLGEVISSNNLRQLRVAESEKGSFVTYYFNGYREESFRGEDRIIIPSPIVSTYYKKPEMSAFEIKDAVITNLRSDYSFILVNFANPDMVGHSGFFKPTVRACEVVDQCLGKIAQQVLKDENLLIITADHGNAETKMTEHTNNPVPIIFVSNNLKNVEILQGGVLSDIAPTILPLMGIPTPQEMSVKNLLCYSYVRLRENI